MTPLSKALCRLEALAAEEPPLVPVPTECHTGANCPVLVDDPRNVNEAQQSVPSSERLDPPPELSATALLEPPEVAPFLGLGASPPSLLPLPRRTAAERDLQRGVALLCVELPIGSAADQETARRHRNSVQNVIVNLARSLAADTKGKTLIVQLGERDEPMKAARPAAPPPATSDCRKLPQHIERLLFSERTLRRPRAQSVSHGVSMVSASHLFSGSSSSGETLTSTQVAFLADCREQYRWSLWNAGPWDPHALSALVRRCDGVLLLVDAYSSGGEAERNTVREIRAAGGTLAAVMLCEAPLHLPLRPAQGSMLEAA